MTSGSPQAGKTTGNQVAGPDVDEGTGRPGGGLPVAGQAAVAIEPCERTLHNPTFGQDLEALLARGRKDDFDAQVQGLRGGLDNRTLVTSIGPHQLQPRGFGLGLSQNLGS